MTPLVVSVVHMGPADRIKIRQRFYSDGQNNPLGTQSTSKLASFQTSTKITNPYLQACQTSTLPLSLPVANTHTTRIQPLIRPNRNVKPIPVSTLRSVQMALICPHTRHSCPYHVFLHSSNGSLITTIPLIESLRAMSIAEINDGEEKGVCCGSGSCWSRY